MTGAGTDGERSSTHTVISSPRYAVVEFDGPSRRIRRVMALFGSPQTAELWAVESGWSDYAVARALIVTALRD